MKKILLLGLVVLLALATGVALAGKGYPKRNITAVVVWGAGGGTDTCNRIIHAEMSKFLGVNVNVINKTGGVAGSVGMSHAYKQKHDGYTLCGLSESNVTAGVQGGWDKKFDVWDTFIVGGSPDVISVTPNTPYKTLQDLIEAAKKNPNTIKAAASGAGSIHHLNLLAVENGSGADFNFIPYKGSAPSQNAAMTGEVSVVEGLGTIPSSFDAYPGLSKYLPISQAIGFAVPADAPEEAKQVLRAAFKKAMATDKVKSWAKENYYLLSGKTGAESKKVFDALESNFAIGS